MFLLILVADMRKILENAFTIGFVMSLAKPHRAKHDVMRMNGTM